MTETSGYAAEYASTDGVLCYGFGATFAVAVMRANHQISGATAVMKAKLRERISYRAVGPDEASEIMEMLETPW